MMGLQRLLAVLPLALAVTGCNAHQAAAGQQPQFQTAGVQHSFQQPTFQQVPMQQQIAQNNAFQVDYGQQLAALKAETTQEISAMGERVRRVERAMIRLDRRMQVIERNELVKVSGLQDGSIQPASPLGAGRFQPTSFGQNAHTSQPVSPFARGAAVLSRTPFSARGRVDTQDLNADHVSIAPLQPAQPIARSQPGAANPRFASLADTQADSAADTQVAIWTVSYDPRKIWPDRGELAASSEVVSALRAGRPVSIFARGARPSSKEFRERVRALSRYLGRVSNLESVPIAAMPADHLSNDTIELLVAN